MGSFLQVNHKADAIVRPLMTIDIQKDNQNSNVALLPPPGPTLTAWQGHARRKART